MLVSGHGDGSDELVGRIRLTLSSIEVEEPMDLLLRSATTDIQSDLSLHSHNMLRS